MLLRGPALTFSVVSEMLNYVLAGPGWSVMLSLTDQCSGSNEHHRPGVWRSQWRQRSYFLNQTSRTRFKLISRMVMLLDAILFSSEERDLVSKAKAEMEMERVVKSKSTTCLVLFL